MKRVHVFLGVAAMAVMAMVVVFACSKPTKDTSEVINSETAKTEKSNNCIKVTTPKGCCFKVCADCDEDFSEFINTVSHGRQAIEMALEDCGGMPYIVHFEYFGPLPATEQDLKNSDNWLWARATADGQTLCSCVRNIPCGDNPDEIKDLWFDAIDLLYQNCP